MLKLKYSFAAWQRMVASKKGCIQKDAPCFARLADLTHQNRPLDCCLERRDCITRDDRQKMSGNDRFPIFLRQIGKSERYNLTNCQRVFVTPLIRPLRPKRSFAVGCTPTSTTGAHSRGGYRTIRCPSTDERSFLTRLPGRKPFTIRCGSR